MTCIVGMLDKETDTVIIGGDSAGVSDYNLVIRKDSKVFRNGDFIFGCTTSFRMIQLLKYSFVPPEIGNKEIYEYMCSDFINALRECFSSGGYIQKYQEGDDKGGVFLVGYKNRLFRVESDFDVGEAQSDFDSCGSGENFALAVLYTLKEENMSTKEKLNKALLAAESLCVAVSSPFVFVNT